MGKEEDTILAKKLKKAFDIDDSDFHQHGSRFSWTDIEAEATAAGVNAFMSKPIFKSRVAYVFRNLTGQGIRQSRKSLWMIIKEADFTDKRILLAEDNEINAEITEGILGTTGMRADHVCNGQGRVAQMANDSGEQRISLKSSDYLKKPGNTGIPRDIKTEFTTKLLHNYFLIESRHAYYFCGFQNCEFLFIH